MGIIQQQQEDLKDKLNMPIDSKLDEEKEDKGTQTRMKMKTVRGKGKSKKSNMSKIGEEVSFSTNLQNDVTVNRGTNPLDATTYSRLGIEDIQIKDAGFRGTAPLEFNMGDTPQGEPDPQNLKVPSHMPESDDDDFKRATSSSAELKFDFGKTINRKK